MQNLIAKLLPLEELYLTVKRFPLSVICALALFCIAFGSIHDLGDWDEEFTAKLCVVLGCSYFWLGSVKLMAESLKAGLVTHAVLAVFGVASFIFAVSVSGPWAMSFMFITPALLLILMFAPYLKSGDDLSAWFYNRMVWFGVAVSYIALLLFAGGVSVALMAINTLFDFDVGHEIYEDIWAFACLVLGPIYALSWVPKTFEFSEENCTDPPGLKFIVNWISVPMVFVYLAILYAYFIKIVVSQDVPSGHLAYLITGFIGAGTLTYLVSWPLRENGSFQLKLFHKIFFAAIIIPTGFHFYAIAERIGAYGITEQRYFIALSAVWFAILALGNVFKRMPIKYIPASLAVLMIIASFGPWSAVNLSSQSQFSRLETLMVKHDLLKDGKIQKTEEDIPFDDRLSISSIFDYICETGRDAMIEPWFNIESKEDWSCYGGYNITEKLGFDHTSEYMRNSHRTVHFNVYTNKDKLLAVRGYEFLLKNQRLYAREEKSGVKIKTNCTAETELGKLVVSLNKKSDLIFRIDEDIILTHNLMDFVTKNKDTQNASEILMFDVENDKIKARVFVTNFRGTDKEDDVGVANIGFDLAFTIKD